MGYSSSPYVIGTGWNSAHSFQFICDELLFFPDTSVIVLLDNAIMSSIPTIHDSPTNIECAGKENPARARLLSPWIRWRGTSGKKEVTTS